MKEDKYDKYIKAVIVIGLSMVLSLVLVSINGHNSPKDYDGHYIGLINEMIVNGSSATVIMGGIENTCAVVQDVDNGQLIVENNGFSIKYAVSLNDQGIPEELKPDINIGGAIGSTGMNDLASTFGILKRVN